MTKRAPTLSLCTLFTLNMHHTATYSGPSTSAPGDGSRTVTITAHDSEPIDENDNDGTESSSDAVVGALRLRGGPRRRNVQRVAWEEGTIDNEGAGKKKSKSMPTIYGWIDPGL